jgi:hypothetical protein
MDIVVEEEIDMGDRDGTHAAADRTHTMVENETGQQWPKVSFDKTGARRQAEVVRLLTSLGPP